MIVAQYKPEQLEEMRQYWANTLKIQPDGDLYAAEFLYRSQNMTDPEAMYSIYLDVYEKWAGGKGASPVPVTPTPPVPGKPSSALWWLLGLGGAAVGAVWAMKGKK